MFEFLWKKKKIICSNVLFRIFIIMFAIIVPAIFGSWLVEWFKVQPGQEHEYKKARVSQPFTLPATINHAE